MLESFLSFGSLLLGAFLAGLGGSFHCLGMCGPIATVLGSQASSPGKQLAYQGGRLLSYMLIGVLGAGLLVLISQWSGIRIAAQIFRLLLALSLLLIGAYLLFNWRLLDAITRMGTGVWQFLRPLAGRWLPPRHLGQAFMLGMLWGWLPCGMVYAMVSVAWATNDVVWAAATMLAFGLGTTPMVMGAASGSAWISTRIGRSGLRRLSGLLLILAALFSLFQFFSSLGTGHKHGHHANHSMAAQVTLATNSH